MYYEMLKFKILYIYIYINIYIILLKLYPDWMTILGQKNQN